MNRILTKTLIEKKLSERIWFGGEKVCLLDNFLFFLSHRWWIRLVLVSDELGNKLHWRRFLKGLNDGHFCMLHLPWLLMASEYSTHRPCWLLVEDLSECASMEDWHLRSGYQSLLKWGKSQQRLINATANEQLTKTLFHDQVWTQICFRQNFQELICLEPCLFSCGMKYGRVKKLLSELTTTTHLMRLNLQALRFGYLWLSEAPDSSLWHYQFRQQRTSCAPLPRSMSDRDRTAACHRRRGG